MSLKTAIQENIAYLAIAFVLSLTVVVGFVISSIQKQGTFERDNVIRTRCENDPICAQKVDENHERCWSEAAGAPQEYRVCLGRAVVHKVE